MEYPTTSLAVVALLTDFGQSDGYVGVMKGVILRIAPHMQIVDITHDIAPQDVASGAWILATCYRYFPRNTIFTCVVDPGVGSSRHPIALHAGEWYFVGPDNGLFHYVISEQPVHTAVILDQSDYHLSEVSSTFHGRDIFSPVAAHIASGATLSQVGSLIAPTELQRLGITPLQHEGNQIAAHIAHIDHFGNIITDIPLSLVPDLLERSGIQLILPAQHATVAARRSTFASQYDPAIDKQPFIYGDSSGHVAIAIRNDNAARTLRVKRGDPVTLISGESG
jgi:hypothetical protein